MKAHGQPLAASDCIGSHLISPPSSPPTQGDGIRERLSEQQYRRLVDYVTWASQFLSPSPSSLQMAVTLAEPPPSVTKCYRYLVEPAFAAVFVSRFTMVKNKALRIGFH